MRSQKEVLEKQISILKSVFQWHKGYVLSEEQARELTEWVGWGYCKAVLMNPWKDSEWETASEADKKLRPVVKELYTLLEEELAPESYKQVVDSIRASVLSSYYTPKVVTDTLFKVLSKYTNITSIMDPSAGGGVFVLSAMNHLPNLEKVTCYEKDMLTAKVLQTIMKACPQKGVTVHNKGFEESDKSEDGKYSIVATNPPYGNYAVWDENCTDRSYTTKIHNYFVWKSIQKLSDGGILALLITNSFLDTPTNRTVRKYLYSNADHISVIVMPDNTMKESANTEAPSHLIIARRRYGKTEADMSEEEKLLCESQMKQIQADGAGKKVVVIAMNSYIDNYGGDVVIGEQTVGKNQYGKPSIETWWNDAIDNISTSLSEMLHRDMRLAGMSKLSTKDIVKEGEMIWDDQIVDIPEEEDEEEEESVPWEEEEIKGVRMRFDDNPEHNIVIPDISKFIDNTPEIVMSENGEMVIGDITPTEDYIYTVKLVSEQSVIETIIKETLQVSDIQSTTPLKVGMVLSLPDGQSDLYTTKTRLVQITAIDGDKVEVQSAPVKPGREENIMKEYIGVRDTYNELTKAEQDENSNRM